MPHSALRILALVLMTAGSVQWARGRRRQGYFLVPAGLSILLVASWGPVAHRLTFILEADAPRTFHSDLTYDVVVLLGGAVDHAGYSAPEPAYGDGVERLLVTYDLLRKQQARFAVASGGRAFLGGPTEAKVLTDQLADWGIARDRLILDERAANTHENAVEVARLVKERGFRSVLILTSAFHMKRALGCFNAVGLEVDTLPVDYRMRDPGRWHDWLPRSRHLEESTEALHEFAGRLVYRIAGYSK